MGSKRSLLDSERVTIDVVHSAGMSAISIVECLKRSRKIVSRYLKDPEGYGKKHGFKTWEKLPLQDKRNIIIYEKDEAISLTNGEKHLNVRIIGHYVCQFLFQHKELLYIKLKKKPALLLRHISALLTWARERVSQSWMQQKLVIFSGVKK